MGIVYLITSNYVDFKIGVTTRPINERIRELQTSHPEKIDIIKFYKAENHNAVERWLHRKFNEKRLEGEWFQLDETDINQFESLCQSHDKVITLLKEENHFFSKKDKF